MAKSREQRRLDRYREAQARQAREEAERDRQEARRPMLLGALPPGTVIHDVAMDLPALDSRSQVSVSINGNQQRVPRSMRAAANERLREWGHSAIERTMCTWPDQPNPIFSAAIGVYHS